MLVPVGFGGTTGESAWKAREVSVSSKKYLYE